MEGPEVRAKCPHCHTLFANSLLYNSSGSFSHVDGRGLAEGTWLEKKSNRLAFKLHLQGKDRGCVWTVFYITVNIGMFSEAIFISYIVYD